VFINSLTREGIVILGFKSRLGLGLSLGLGLGTTGCHTLSHAVYRLSKTLLSIAFIDLSIHFLIDGFDDWCFEKFMI